MDILFLIHAIVEEFFLVIDTHETKKISNEQKMFMGD